MVSRPQVVHVTTEQTSGTGFLARGLDRRIYLFADVLFTYASEKNRGYSHWSEKPKPSDFIEFNVDEDWAIFLVHDSGPVCVWDLASLDRGDTQRRFGSFGFPQGFEGTGIHCGGTVREARVPFPIHNAIKPTTPVIQLQVDELAAGAPMPAAGFSGAPVVVRTSAGTEYVVGLITGFFAMPDTVIAFGGTAFSIPAEFVANRILGHPGRVSVAEASERYFRYFKPAFIGLSAGLTMILGIVLLTPYELEEIWGVGLGWGIAMAAVWLLPKNPISHSPPAHYATSGVPASIALSMSENHDSVHGLYLCGRDFVGGLVGLAVVAV